MDNTETKDVSLPESNMPMNNINQGTVAIESSRAVAEAQGKLIIAKRFPRNETDAFAKAMQACQRIEFAKKGLLFISKR